MTTDAQRLGRVFVELADILVEQFDLVDFLTTLAHRCVELLDSSQAGVVLASEDGVLSAVASTDETVAVIDLFELQNHQGPTLDCIQLAEPLTNLELAVIEDRWPGFAPLVAGAGFCTVHALPMRVHGKALGAVNIFSDHTTGLVPADLEVAQALADIATIALIQERKLRVSTMVNEQLQTALNSRIVIEQAKGVLAERHQIDMDVAFRALRAYARSHQRLLTDVAREVTNGARHVDEMVASGRAARRG